jgi:hypothetical protein
MAQKDPVAANIPTAPLRVRAGMSMARVIPGVTVMIMATSFRLLTRGVTFAKLCYTRQVFSACRVQNPARLRGRRRSLR